MSDERQEPVDQPLELRGNCQQCAALCCIAYPAQEMEGFAASKQAGEPCPHLAPNGDCQIYVEREKKGFAGCLQYDCLGAGQYVTQSLFKGSDWRDNPALLPPMVESFLQARPLFDLLYLINHARTRAPDKAQSQTLTQAETNIHTTLATRETLLKAGAIEQAEHDVKRVVRELGR